MSRRVSEDEFHKHARSLFLNLRNWSGETLESGSLDSDARRYARMLVDTGKMAALRRARISDGEPMASAAWVIEPYIPGKWETNSPAYSALYKAALLYTIHPHTKYMQEETKYGSPITRIFLEANGGVRGSDDETRANDRRINFLLDARPDEIYNRLARVLVPLMNKTEIPVDWIQLARDLRDWDEPVRLRWSRGWYGGQRFMRSPDALPEDPINENPNSVA